MNTNTYLISRICIGLIVSVLTLQSILSILEGRSNSPRMIATATAPDDDMEKIHRVLHLLAQSDL